MATFFPFRKKEEPVETTETQKARPAMYPSLGVTGLKKTGNYVYEEFLPYLRWPQAGRIYQEMSDNDPVIGSILYLAEMLVRGVSWHVKEADNTAEAKEAAEFVKECMNDMEMSWHDTISEILSVFTYGFSFHEVLYKVRRGQNETSPKYYSKYNDGKVGWRGFPIRSQATMEGWEFDKWGNVEGFRQLTTDPSIFVTIPMTKGLLFRTRVSRDNPEGKSLLRNAYRPWYFKKHLEEIEGIGIERDLAGFPVLQPPEGVDLWNKDDPMMTALLANAQAVVSNVRRDSEEGLVLPYGWDLKLLSSPSSRQIDIGETIERYDKRIAITMLSDLILLGEKSGSFALADSKQSLLASALQSQLDTISDVFNTKAIPKLFKLNGMSISIAPSIVPGQIATPALKEVALVLRSMGLNIAGDKEIQDHLRRVLDFPELSKEVFDEVYAPQQVEADSATATVLEEEERQLLGDFDEVDREFEQNDLNYEGGDNVE